MPIADHLVRRTLEQVERLRLLLTNDPGSPEVAEAAAFLPDAFRRTLGTDPDVVRSLPSEELLAVMSSTGSLDAERAYVTAALLEVDAYSPSRDDGERGWLQLRALDLMLAAAMNRVGETDVWDRIARLRRALRDIRLPEATYERLLAYHTAAGRYAPAEDLLFEWFEEHGSLGSIRAVGEAFFAGLAQVSDAELEEGDLPRSEVGEARDLFLRQVGP